MHKDCNISVVIPLFNEQENIPILTDRLNNLFANNKEYNAEVVFVDDGSTDQSLETIRRLEHNSYKVKIIKLARNFGSHAALRAGIYYSSAPIVMFLPADMQDPPELLNIFYERLMHGFNVVWGYRSSIKTGFTDKIFSTLYSILMKRFTTPNYPKVGLDLVIFDDKVKKELNLQVEANSSIFLQVLIMGFQQDFIPYERSGRNAGKSKWTLSKKTKLFIDSFVAFSYAPVRLVTFTGITISVLGFIWLTHIIFRTLIFGDLDPGWPSMIGILLIGFGITNISLGIIAEYLWRTLDASRKRKVFIVDDVIEIN